MKQTKRSQRRARREWRARVGRRAVTVWLLFSLPLVQALAQTPAGDAGQQDQRGIRVKQEAPKTSTPEQEKARGARPELVLQTGHGNLYGASRFAFSPDGRLLATATLGGGAVKLWEVATGRELRTFAGGATPAGNVPAVAFSRDGRMLAVGAGDNTVRVWDVATGRELQTFSAAGNSLFSAAGVAHLAFSADGRALVSVSDAIRTWDMATGGLTRALDLSPISGAGELAASGLAFSGFAGPGGGLVLSPDAAHLVGVAADREGKTKLRFYDTATGRESRGVPLSGVEESSDLPVSAVSLAADGGARVAGVSDGKLKLWEAGAGGAARVLADNVAQKFVAVKFSPDGRLLAAETGKSVFTVWDVATGREVSRVNAPDAGLPLAQTISVVEFSPDGRLLAVGGFFTQPSLWETETGRAVRTLKGQSNMAYSVAFSADGARLSSGGKTRWDLKTGSGLRLAVRPPGRTHTLPSPDGRLLAEMTVNSPALKVIDAATGRELHSLAPGAASGGAVQQFAFSPDGRLLATSYMRSFAEMSRKPAHANDYPRAVPEAAKKNPGELLRMYQEQMSKLRGGGGIEQQVKIWDVATGRELHTVVSPDFVAALQFSHDGRSLAVTGAQSGVGVWDVATGNRLYSVGGPPPQMAGGPSMPAGAASDPQELLRNALSGMAAQTAAAGQQQSRVEAVAFSPDGRLVAGGGKLSRTSFDPTAMMRLVMSQKAKPEEMKQELMKMYQNMKVETTGLLALFDAATGREAAGLPGHGRGVRSVAFSADNRLLASAGTDNTIKLWDVAARTELRTLAGHTSGINSLAFSPDARLVASAGDDGSTLLWDAQTGEHLATLVSLYDGGDWLVVTPGGLFDGSPAAWNQILWRFSQNTFDVSPVETFFNEFFHPGLLAELAAGKRPKAPRDISLIDRRQPALALDSEQAAGTAATSRTIKVRVRVTKAEAGAKDVRLFRNGSLVRVWRGDVLGGQPSATLEATIPVVAGQNRLTAYAFNRDNVKSDDAELAVVGADSLKRAGTAYVLAVGVNSYANPQYDLRYAVADAQAFAEEVRRRQTQLGVYERVEVVALLDAEATKANVLDALRRLSGGDGAAPPAAAPAALEKLRRAEPEDAVIIYFAGHGTAQADRFYLIPHDLGYMGARERIDEASLREVVSHSISDEELERAVEGLDAGQLLLVIDACNSGQALEAEEKRRGPMNSKGLAQLAYEKGMYILTAAQSYQAALEAAQLGHGLLTYALVEEGLKAGAADGAPQDGTLVAREWFDFAAERVPLMQVEQMKRARGRGLSLVFAASPPAADSNDDSVQRPRAFYRRELESNPMIVAVMK